MTMVLLIESDVELQYLHHRNPNTHHDMNPIKVTIMNKPSDSPKEPFWGEQPG